MNWRLRAEAAEAIRDVLVDALVDVVNQACRDAEGRVDSSLSAYSDALNLLAEHGRFRIEHQVGRRIIGHWTTAAKRNNCPVFRPDHNGECIVCDEPIDAHTPEAIAAGGLVALGLIKKPGPDPHVTNTCISADVEPGCTGQGRPTCTAPECMYGIEECPTCHGLIGLGCRCAPRAVACGCTLHAGPNAEPYDGREMVHGCGIRHAGPCNVACSY